MSTGSPLNLTSHWSGSSDETRKNLDEASKLLYLAQLLFSHKLAAADWNEADHITAKQASGLPACVPQNKEKINLCRKGPHPTLLRTEVSVSSDHYRHSTGTLPKLCRTYNIKRGLFPKAKIIQSRNGS
jgi:hypothetical protein